MEMLFGFAHRRILPAAESALLEKRQPLEADPHARESLS